MTKVTSSADRFINQLASTLDIPDERYASADRSYRSICDWLERPESRFSRVYINAYTQGSFRLGTVIRPLNGEEHYDLDVVCEFGASKVSRTQKQLFDDLGHELKLYAARYSMESPSGWDRCWTLNYADAAQFHIDLLPSIPDGQRQRTLREERNLSLEYVEKSISITDRNHPKYQQYTDDWPSSNPNGYADWFMDRMEVAFNKRRRAMALYEAKADVADIPAFRVKTPLQSAIQILKRHRDVCFSERPDGRPSSIIISTLAAHAYQQEATVTGALFSILASMDQHIKIIGQTYWIANPSDPRENFADAWEAEPERKLAFDDWLDTARKDFERAGETEDLAQMIDLLSPRLGRELLEKAATQHSPAAVAKSVATRRLYGAIQRVFDAPHRKPVAWPTVPQGSVSLSSVMSRAGFRPTAVANNGAAVPIGSSLRFEAKTNLVWPYKVFWQVVNTGPAAMRANNLRGGFLEGTASGGNLFRIEGAYYKGSHTIECFIVKDGYCAARSGPFVVNID
ncbi:nucleotidyltransferase [Pseudomonas benzopyrenica]|uniref:Cyclic GMP-AMP synthase n=1 Tax=Pseudomonas benzopyrenica TaxID=2993566 RepID=A0ABZ2FLJ9_9PSED